MSWSWQVDRRSIGTGAFVTSCNARGKHRLGSPSRFDRRDGTRYWKGGRFGNWRWAHRVGRQPLEQSGATLKLGGNCLCGVGIEIARAREFSYLCLGRPDAAQLSGQAGIEVQSAVSTLIVVRVDRRATRGASGERAGGASLRIRLRTTEQLPKDRGCNHPEQMADDGHDRQHGSKPTEPAHSAPAGAR